MGKRRVLSASKPGGSSTQYRTERFRMALGTTRHSARPCACATTGSTAASSAARVSKRTIVLVSRGMTVRSLTVAALILSFIPNRLHRIELGGARSRIDSRRQADDNGEAYGCTDRKEQ